MVKKISISLNEEIFELIEEKKERRMMDRSAVIQDSLERYHTLINRGKQYISRKFNDNELSLIVDSGNGTWFSPDRIQLLPHQIIDAIEFEGLDEKWDVNAEKLIEKLQELSEGHLHALVEFIEIYWVNARENPMQKRDEIKRYLK